MEVHYIFTDGSSSAYCIFAQRLFRPALVSLCWPAAEEKHVPLLVLGKLAVKQLQQYCCVTLQSRQMCRFSYSALCSCGSHCIGVGMQTSI